MKKPDAPAAVVTLSFGTLRAGDLREGVVVPLDAAADAPVRILVDGKAVAEGVLVVDGGELVVRVERRL